MPRNQAGGAQRKTVIRDRVSGDFVKRDADTGRTVDGKRSKSPRREILFPTEPTTISREKIDRAIEQVIARRK